MATIDFKERVLDRSFEVPVVVDFWAAWCGPCRVLGPVITEMAGEADGAWELVKVDTEANQEIAKEYGIYSIPNVKMFYKGEAVAEFTGALPKQQIASWLEEHLPNPDRAGMQEVLEQVKAAPSPQSLQLLADFSQEHPGLFEAELYLNWFRAGSQPDEVKSWLQTHHANPKYSAEFQDIAALVELAQTEPMGTEGFVKAYQQAIAAINKVEPGEAMRHLVQTVMFNKSFQNDLPRRAIISLFHLMGEGHPLTKKYRPHFSMALY